MKELLHAFLALPSWEGILLIVAGVGLLTAVWLSGRMTGFRRGEQHSEWRHERVTRQRRELASIQL